MDLLAEIKAAKFKPDEDSNLPELDLKVILNDDGTRVIREWSKNGHEIKATISQADDEVIKTRALAEFSGEIDHVKSKPDNLGEPATELKMSLNASTADDPAELFEAWQTGEHEDVSLTIECRQMEMEGFDSPSTTISSGNRSMGKEKAGV